MVNTRRDLIGYLCSVNVNKKRVLVLMVLLFVVNYLLLQPNLGGKSVKKGVTGHGSSTLPEYEINHEEDETAELNTEENKKPEDDEHIEIRDDESEVEEGEEKGGEGGVLEKEDDQRVDEEVEKTEESEDSTNPKGESLSPFLVCEKDPTIQHSPPQKV